MKKLTVSMMLLAASAFAFNASAQDDFSKGTGYHLIYLDAVSSAKIPAANITKDFRTDDVNNFLYIWESTYTSDAAAGPNWNGEVGEYLSFSVTSVGWSGWGFASPAATPKDMSGVTADYTLHFAMKGTNNASHAIICNGGTGLEGKVTVGATPFIDGGKAYPVAGNFARDGKWHLIEIPMSVFFNQGLRYPAPTSGNVFAMLSGGVAGTNVQIDAIFFYKKGTTAVNDVKAEKLDVLISSKTLSVIGATKGIELYSVTGFKVRTSNEAIMGIEGIQKGIYIVRCGQLSQKVEIR